MKEEKIDEISAVMKPKALEEDKYAMTKVEGESLEIIGPDQVAKAVQLLMDDVIRRAAEMSVAVAVSDTALDVIGVKSYDPLCGAKSIGMWIEDQIANKLFEMLKQQVLAENCRVLIDTSPGKSELVYKVDTDAELFKMTQVDCNLPSDITGKILNRLGSEGVRFSVLSRHWKSSWQSAPLHIDDCAFHPTCSASNMLKHINSVISFHSGPVHSLLFSKMSARMMSKPLANWAQCPVFSNLNAITLNFPGLRHDLPGRCLSFPTVQYLSLTNCYFDQYCTLYFPKLRDLRLVGVVLSEHTVDSILQSACSLRTLCLSLNRGHASLRVELAQLHQFYLCLDREVENGPGGQLSALEDVFVRDITITCASLERVLIYGYAQCVKIKAAPNLRILGHVGREISCLDIENSSFKGMNIYNRTSMLESVKILSLNLELPDLARLLKFLSVFPLIEELHINFFAAKDSTHCAIENVPKSLPHTLKKIAFTLYEGSFEEIDFVKFFIENGSSVEEFCNARASLLLIG